MRIFLDDKRPLPDKREMMSTARSYNQCILWLELSKGAVEFITLDYDLGTTEHTGLDVLVFMKENKIVPNHINIHSDHPKGKVQMQQYCLKHFSNVSVTLNPL